MKEQGWTWGFLDGVEVHPCSFISLSPTMVCPLQHPPGIPKSIPVPSSLFPPPWSVSCNTLQESPSPSLFLHLSFPHHGLSTATPSRNPQVHPCSFISLSSTMVCPLQHPPGIPKSIPDPSSLFPPPWSVHCYTIQESPSPSLFLHLSFLHHGLSTATPSRNPQVHP